MNWLKGFSDTCEKSPREGSFFKMLRAGTSLGIQWLKPPSNAGDMGSIPGLEGSHMQEDPTWRPAPKLLALKNTLSLSHVISTLNIILSCRQ